MNTPLENVMAVIRKYAPNFYPKVGIILGSGLSNIADQIVDPITIPYAALPGICAGTVSGHASLMILGHLNNVPVVCLKGRLHLYEGVSHDAIRLLIRTVKQLGAQALIVTCAAGSLRTEVGPGELLRITDHINLQPGNPLVGPNDESIGPRFVSMENAYDVELNESLMTVAQRMGTAMHAGVYLSVLGPVFETPAEIRAFKSWGADAVGMSVVPEVIIARHCGLRVVGIAAITNLAVGLSEEKVTHALTLHYGELMVNKFSKLVASFVGEIGPKFGV